MNVFTFSRLRSVAAVAVLAVAGMAVAEVDEQVVTSEASATSSTFVSGGIGECEFDLIVLGGGTVESISLKVRGPLAECDCKLASNPGVHGAVVQGSARDGLTVSKIPQPLPEGAVLLHCDSDEFIEGRQVVRIDFTDIEATVIAASSADRETASSPRVCATGISCDYFGGGDLDWKQEPDCGDSNYDGRITAGDALAALRTAVGHASCVPVRTVCDPNDDKQVSAADALRILQVSVGYDLSLHCPAPCYPDPLLS